MVCWCRRSNSQGTGHTNLMSVLAFVDAFGLAPPTCAHTHRYLAVSLSYVWVVQLEYRSSVGGTAGCVLQQCCVTCVKSFGVRPD